MPSLLLILSVYSAIIFAGRTRPIQPGSRFGPRGGFRPSSFSDLFMPVQTPGTYGSVPLPEALGSALQFIMKNVTWSISTEEPPYRVRGDYQFDHYLAGDVWSFPDRARQAVLRAIVSVTENISPSHDALVRRHASGDLEARLRGRAYAQVSRAIDKGGYKAVCDLIAGRLPDWFAPPTLTEGAADHEAWLISAWPQGCATPDSREMQKAVKYAFGQKWEFMKRGPASASFEIRECYRSKPHFAGTLVDTDANRARTSVFQSIGLCAFLLDEADWLAGPERSRVMLRQQMLDAVSSGGFQGLVRFGQARMMDADKSDPFRA